MKNPEGYPDPTAVEAIKAISRAERRRQQKDREKVYTLTRAQLDEVRRQAVEEKKKEIGEKMMREAREMVEKEWAEREKMFTGVDEEERMKKILCLLMAVPVKVLCEKFRWQPVRDENDHRSRLMQFCEAVVKETNKICEDENADVRKIDQEVYEKYGVRYELK